MDRKNIFEDQNSTFMLSLLKAQKEMYASAKKRLYIPLGVTIIGMVIFSILSKIIETDSISAISIMFSAIMISVNTYYGYKSNKLKELGATIQQTFDVKLFNISEDFGVLNESEIADLTADYKESEIKKFKNWYCDYSSFTFTKQIFHCQQENMQWDIDLRKKYLDCNIIVGSCLSIGIFLYSVYYNLTMFQMFALLVWAIPILQYVFAQYKDVYENIESLKSLKQKYALIENNLENYDEGELYSKLCNLQLYIFEHRKKALLIPDWFYNFFREKIQYHEDNIAKQKKSNNSELPPVS